MVARDQMIRNQRTGRFLMAYADYTRNTVEPIKRIAHGRRFAQVVSLIALPLESDMVLDYGCGDGHLFSHFLGRLGKARLVGYDPNPKLLAEASVEVDAGATLTPDVEALKLTYSCAFSLIYCMEVCEHLTDAALDTLLSNIRALSAPQARIVFGVPIETGLSGFLKALYRIAHSGRQNANITDAIKALCGIRINRQITDIEWHGSHAGFDYRRFKGHLEDFGFEIGRSICLPWPTLGTVLNNEIYFVCSFK